MFQNWRKVQGKNTFSDDWFRLKLSMTNIFCQIHFTLRYNFDDLMAGHVKWRKTHFTLFDTLRHTKMRQFRVDWILKKSLLEFFHIINWVTNKQPNILICFKMEQFLWGISAGTEQFITHFRDLNMDTRIFD